MRVPQEILCQILGYIVEVLPLRDIMRARLVNHLFAEEIMAYLIPSPRLENEGFGCREYQKKDVPGWRPFPRELKLRYLRHKMQQHATAPCTLSNWIHEMLETQEREETLLDEEEAIEYLLHGVTSGRFDAHNMFCPEQAPAYMVWYREQRTQYAVRWEPLGSTFKVLLACSAIRQGDARYLAWMLSDEYDLTWFSQRFGLMPLDLAAKRGNGDIIRVLVRFDYPLHYWWEYNCTNVLSVAARSSNKEALEVWIEYLKSKSKSGVGYQLEMAIRSVARIGNADMVKFLLDRCDMKQKELRYRAFIEAVEYGQAMVVEWLLQEGGFDPINANGRCPFLTAFTCKQETQRLETVQVLLNNGVDPNQFYQDTTVKPLEQALLMNDIQTARLLVQHGAKISTKSPHSGVKNTRVKRVAPILLLAAQRGGGPLVQLLLDRGIDPVFSWKGKKYRVEIKDEPIRQIERLFGEFGIAETDVKKAHIDYLLVQIA